jgi:hypothetical protein
VSTSGRLGKKQWEKWKAGEPHRGLVWWELHIWGGMLQKARHVGDHNVNHNFTASLKTQSHHSLTFAPCSPSYSYILHTWFKCQTMAEDKFEEPTEYYQIPIQWKNRIPQVNWIWSTSLTCEHTQIGIVMEQIKMHTQGDSRVKDLKLDPLPWSKKSQWNEI